MFEVKRREQLLALKNLAQLNDIHQQYKILDVMLKGLFKVLEDSRTVLTAADVLPDGPFPQDEKLKDGMVCPILPCPRHHPIFSSCFFSPVLVTLFFSPEVPSCGTFQVVPLGRWALCEWPSSLTGYILAIAFLFFF